MPQPSDLTAIFLAAARSSSQTEQNEIWQRLYPALNAFALRALLPYGFSFPGAGPEDFVQEAIEHLRRKAGKYDPDKGFVEPWLRIVLSNFAKSWVKKQKRLERRRVPVPVEAVEEPADGPQGPNLDHRVPLTDSQLTLLADWPVHQRLAAVCLMGLWQRMVEHHLQLWEEWIGKAEIPQPFPPDDFAGLPPRGRRKCMAHVFHVNPNTVVQWLIRLRKRRVAEV